VRVLNQKLSAYVLSKLLIRYDPVFAQSIGVATQADWRKLNSPSVQNKILAGFVADNPTFDAIVDAVAPVLGLGSYSAPIKWVGDKVGHWLGLGDEPSTHVEPMSGPL